MSDRTSYTYRNKAKRAKVKAKQKVLKKSLPGNTKTEFDHPRFGVLVLIQSERWNQFGQCDPAYVLR